MLGDPNSLKSAPFDPLRAVGRGVAMFLLGLVLSSALVTQFVAARLHFQPALGAPLIGARGTALSLYEPAGWIGWEGQWSWGPWWGCTIANLVHRPCHRIRLSRAHRAYLDQTFLDANIGDGTLVTLDMLLASYWVSRQRKAEPLPTTHGSARWATAEEILDCGFCVGRNRKAVQSRIRRLIRKARRKKRIVGVTVAKFTDPKTGTTYRIRIDDEQPRGVMIIGPPGSGKTDSVIVPTLLDYNGSAVVYDPSFELVYKTAGARQDVLGNEVAIIAPTLTSDNELGITPVGCNVWDTVRFGTEHEIGDVQNLAKETLDPSDRAAEGQEAHWIACGSATFEGVGVYLRYADPEICTYRGMYEFLADPQIGDNVDAAFAKMLKHPLDPELRYGWKDAKGRPTPHHPHVLYLAAQMLRKPANEKGSIISTLLRFLEPYRDPLLDRLTSRSLIHPDELMVGRPKTWYICIPEAEVSRLRFFVRPLLGIITRAQMREGALMYVDNEPRARAQNTLAFFLDEAWQLGPLTQFFNLQMAVRKYKMMAVFVYHSLEQMKECKALAVIGAMRYKVFFPPQDLETAEWEMKQIGEGTAVDETESASGSRFWFRNQVNRARSLHGRYLAKPDELMNSEADQIVLRFANKRPMVVNRFFYKDDRELARRARIAPNLAPLTRKVRYASALIPAPVIPLGKEADAQDFSKRAAAAVGAPTQKPASAFGPVPASKPKRTRSSTPRPRKAKSAADPAAEVPQSAAPSTGEEAVASATAAVAAAAAEAAVVGSAPAADPAALRDPFAGDELVAVIPDDGEDAEENSEHTESLATDDSVEDMPDDEPASSTAAPARQPAAVGSPIVVKPAGAAASAAVLTAEQVAQLAELGDDGFDMSAYDEDATI